jgi:Fe-S cluster biogenesis protein NfuA
MAKRWNLAVGLLAAAAGLLAQEAPEPPLAILMKFDRTPPAGVLDSMQREVAEIFAPAGIQVAWRSLENSDGREVFRHVVVVRFRGACSGNPVSLMELEPLLEETELAHALVRDGRALPFAEVHCDRVSAFLRPWRKAEQAGTLGIAMGRVIAHELYHVLTNTLTHGQGDLSKAHVSAEDLGSRAAIFSPEEIELFKKSMQ